MMREYTRLQAYYLAGGFILTYKVLIRAHMHVHREQVLLRERPFAPGAAAGVAGRADCLGCA